MSLYLEEIKKTIKCRKEYNRLNTFANKYISAVYNFLGADIGPVKEYLKTKGILYNNYHMIIDFDYEYYSLTDILAKVTYFVAEINKTEIIKNNKIFKLYVYYLAYPLKYFSKCKDNVYLFDDTSSIIRDPIKFQDFFKYISHSYNDIDILCFHLSDFLDEAVKVLKKEENKIYQNMIPVFLSIINSGNDSFFVPFKRQILNIKNKQPESDLHFNYTNFINKSDEKCPKIEYKIEFKEMPNRFIILWYKTRGSMLPFLCVHYISNPNTDLAIFNPLAHQNRRFYMEILGLSSFKHSVFGISEKLSKNTGFLYNMYNLKNPLRIYKGNVIAIDDRNIPISYIFLNLRDYLLDTIFRGVYNYEYFKQIYNCLYEEVINKSYIYPEIFNKHVLVKYNLPYDVGYYLFVDNYDILESCNAEPEFIKPHIVPVKNLSPSNYLKNDEKPSDNLLYLFRIMTNNNYHIMNNFLRILVNYVSVRKCEKNSYIFINCSEKIFDLYKAFFRRIKKNEIYEYNSIKKLGLSETIPELLSFNLNGVGPIFINNVEKMNSKVQNERFIKLLRGKAITDIPKNSYRSSDEQNFAKEIKINYCRYKYENNIPLLILCTDHEAANKLEDSFIKYCYEMKFKNEISDEDYEKCKSIINNLSDEDICFVFYKMVSFGLYYKEPDKTEEKTKEIIPPKDNSAYKDIDIIKEFLKVCCNKEELASVKKRDLFTAYCIYCKETKNITVEKTWFNSFTKILTKLIEDYNNKCENKTDKPKTIKIKGIRIDGVSGYRNLTLKPKYKEKVNTSITNIENQNEKPKNTETEINPKKAETKEKMTGIDILTEKIINF